MRCGGPAKNRLRVTGLKTNVKPTPPDAYVRHAEFRRTNPTWPETTVSPYTSATDVRLSKEIESALAIGFRFVFLHRKDGEDYDYFRQTHFAYYCDAHVPAIDPRWRSKWTIEFDRSVHTK
jgi:hypothetical protein